MTCTMEELKKRVETTTVSGGKLQFTAELRRDIMEYSAEQQTTGRSQQSIAAELGMKGWTLNRWHQNERKAKASVTSTFVDVTPRKRMRAPKISSAMVTPPGAFEVMCPSGFEVRVPSSFDAGALKHLLQTLEGR